jgi:hypothetical protein
MGLGTGAAGEALGLGADWSRSPAASWASHVSRFRHDFVTISSRFRRAFVALSSRFRHDFVTISSRSHRDFVTIPSRFHHDFVAISSQFHHDSIAIPSRFRQDLIAIPPRRRLFAVRLRVARSPGRPGPPGCLVQEVSPHKRADSRAVLGGYAASGSLKDAPLAAQSQPFQYAA